MAIIPIDENWRLKSDELGWVVQRSRRRNESPVNAEHAVESAVKGPPRRDREWTGVRLYVLGELGEKIPLNYFRRDT